MSVKRHSIWVRENVVDETREAYLTSIDHPVSKELTVLRQRFENAKRRARGKRETTITVEVHGVSQEAINVFVLRMQRKDWTSTSITRGGELTAIKFN
jgi:hypothetical protein